MSFDQAFTELLKAEGYFSNDPDDRGGITKYGITKKAMSDYLGRDSTDEDIKTIDQNTAKKLYKQLFWDRLSLDKVNDPILASLIFNQAVNRGTRKVAEQVQIMVGTTPDGVIGPITLYAINSRSPKKLLIDLIKRSQMSYCDIVSLDPSQLKFLKGWISRTHQFLEEV